MSCLQGKLEADYWNDLSKKMEYFAAEREIFDIWLPVICIKNPKIFSSAIRLANFRSYICVKEIDGSHSHQTIKVASQKEWVYCCVFSLTNSSFITLCPKTMLFFFIKWVTTLSSHKHTKSTWGNLQKGITIPLSVSGHLLCLTVEKTSQKGPAQKI